MKKITGILFALVLASGIGRRLDAQVTVVRTLPPSSAPEVPAEWNAPQPEPRTALATGRTQLSGRVSLGGSAGNDASGVPTYGFSTDSRIRLVQPLGQASTMQIDGKALRKNSLDGLQQDYTGEMALLTEKLALNAAGSFAQNETTVAGTSTSAMNAAMKATARTTIMPALPITLSYLHNWTQGEPASATPAQLDSVKLSSAGTIGKLGIELSGAFDSGADAEKDLETLGTNGRLQLTIPAARFLSVLARVSPDYTRTVYTGTGGATTSTSLESNLGLLFPLSDAVQLALLAGRIDAWSASQGIPDALPPRQVTWNGELGAEVKSLSGFSASPAWRIVKTVGGSLLNALSLAGGWATTNEVPLRNARTEGEVSFTTSDGGDLLENKDTWSAVVTMTPAEKMNLAASYSGSFDGGPAVAQGWSWAHKGNAQLSHEPDPLLDYKASASIAGQNTAGGAALTQEYAAGVNLKPRWNLRQLLFGLTETVSISSEALSKASYVMSIPITPAVRTRYALDWEWISRETAGEGPGNNFRHLVGIAVSGETTPVSFSADYAFSHGYRGFRHDVNAGLQFPFSRSFVLEGALALSSFEEDGVPRIPFLFSLALAYEF